MAPVARVGTYCGFIFASLVATGPDLDAFLGQTKGAIDDMLDCAPGGRLEVAGGCFRVSQRYNWKIYLENMHDGLQPMIVHQPSIDPARDGTQQQPDRIGESAFALNVIAANGQTHKSMAALPARIFPSGHTEWRRSVPTPPPIRNVGQGGSGSRTTRACASKRGIDPLSQ